MMERTAAENAESSACNAPINDRASSDADRQQSCQTPRLRDIIQAQSSRKRYPSDEPEVQRERNKKRKLQKTEKVKLRGRLEFPYETEEEKRELFNKLDLIKMKIGGGKLSKINTFEALQRVLDYYICQNYDNESIGESTENQHDQENDVPEYQYIGEQEASTEQLFVCTDFSLKRLVQQVNNHHVSCHKKLTVQNQGKMGHVLSTKLMCEDGHCMTWTSSPHVEGGKFLANIKVAHGFFTSGILPVQYERFCNAATVGVLGEKYLGEVQSIYGDIVKKLAEESQHDALLHEIGQTVLSSLSDNTDDDESTCDGGLDILTDARHCWRKNARFSDVVCLGDRTHKVLRVETISKNDDPCSQRHELLGVQRIYNYLDSVDCTVRTHAHDNNASVTKYIREEQPGTESSKDTWHATKGIARDAKKITAGPASQEGKTWHGELSDKAASIKTHSYWAMKNCEGNAQKLRENLENMTEHYKYNHANCHPLSNCRTKNPYLSSKQHLEDPVAITILTKFIKSMGIYKFAEQYRFCSDTHYVESFNNFLLQYHDKRIVFGESTYLLRINLAILDWNENIDRPKTSTRYRKDTKNPRRQVELPVHTKKTVDFKLSIWRCYLAKLYCAACTV